MKRPEQFKVSRHEPWNFLFFLLVCFFVGKKRIEKPRARVQSIHGVVRQRSKSFRRGKQHGESSLCHLMIYYF